MDSKESRFMGLFHWGFATKPHGIKGGVYIRSLDRTHRPPAKGSRVVLFPKSAASLLPPGGEAHTVADISAGPRSVAYLEGIEDRNGIERIVPFDIKVEHRRKEEADIVGFAVTDEAGAPVGKVEALGTNGVQRLIEVTSQNGRFSIPWVGAFVKRIDLPKRTIAIEVPEYV